MYALKKVIANDNIKGNGRRLFKAFIGRELDLSEFDASNITNMEGMFHSCTIKKVSLDGKFNTSKVRCMASMFDNSRI